MLLVHTYVASSSIEGVGVFAVGPIAAGELIWRLEPLLDWVCAERELHMPRTVEHVLAVGYRYSTRNEPAILIF